jgi:Spy/CpxP family protein refolding chaperone
MELTAEQEQAYADFEQQLARRMEAHHRVVNAQPRSQQDRVSQESKKRISALMVEFGRRFVASFTPEQRAQLDAGLDAQFAEWVAEDQAAAEAQASDTPAAEASPPVVKPGAKPGA